MPLNDGYAYRERLGKVAGKTALSYLTERYRHSSEEEWAARFLRGEVTLDGKRASAGEHVREGQELCWYRPPWNEPEVPQTFGLVHEDAALVAVEKPSGLPTLPSGGFLKNTLLHRVRERWPGAIPLHRLGRATSGLVLFAKSPAVASSLLRSWRAGEVEKRYLGLATGRATEDCYDITAPIGLVPHPRLGAVHGASAEGKPARSVARVLERRPLHTLFQIDIFTGRPEQIRIHLAVIGHPLSGDPMYGAGGLPLSEAPGLPGDGGYLLHAESLGFMHPETGLRMRLHCAPPPELVPEGEHG